MSKPQKPVKDAAQPAESAALMVVQWLRSDEGRTRSAQTFQKTEKMLEEYRALQVVDPKTIQRPVTL